MAGDPNRDRDRALRGIEGYLKSIDRSLKKLVRLQELRAGTSTMDDYYRGEDSDSTDPASGTEHVGPYGSGPAPYGT